MDGAAGVQRLALAAMLALAAAEALWELVWAPARPGGSWLALKALPLALLWFFAARGSLRAWQVALLILPFYFADALVAALTRGGRAQAAALLAVVLSVLAFAAGLAAFRLRARGR
jgi:uncharacterized membrane protein